MFLMARMDDPNLSSSALIFVFDFLIFLIFLVFNLICLVCFIHHLSQISPIKGIFVYVKTTYVKAIGDNYVRNTIRLSITCVIFVCRFCMYILL
jgi:hypothetical protein